MRVLISRASSSKINDHPTNLLESRAKMSLGKYSTNPLQGGAKTLPG